MSNKIDIRPDHLEIVQDILHEHLPRGVKVWVFGSRATWKAKDFSDLDLALEGQAKLPNDLMIDLETAFDESDLPWKVDLLDVHNTTDTFLKAIKQDKVAFSLKKGGGMRELIPLNNFILLQRGFDLPKKDRNNGNVPVVASTGIGGYHDQVKVKAPGVVIGQSGSIGGGQYITEDFWPLNTTLWVKDFKGHDPRFIYYLLKNIDFSTFNVGSGVPTLNRNHLSSILISDMGLEAEQRIAKIIGNLDDKIENNRRMNATLEGMAQAIFKSWFVDFDPVHAKVEALKNGGSQDDARLKAMCAISGKTSEALEHLKSENFEAYAELHRTADAFPSAFIDSPLGQIPKGWDSVYFSNIVEKYIDNRGKTPPLSELGIPLLEVKHLPDGKIKPSLNTEKRVNQDTYDSWFRAHLEKEDIIISTVGTIGRLCMVPEGTKMVIAQNLLGLRFNSHKASPYFMYYQMNSSRFRHDIESRLVITVQKSIKRKDMETIDLLLPSIEIQHAFEKIIKLFVTIQLRDENQSLAEIRDALLPKLLSSEIDINKENV